MKDFIFLKNPWYWIGNLIGWVFGCGIIYITEKL